MKNLVITAAGLSSRFEGLKPKWMLTHPKGNWMIVEALKNLDFDNIDKVYLGFLQEHIDKFNCRDAINLCIKELGIEDFSETFEETRLFALNKKINHFIGSNKQEEKIPKEETFINLVEDMFNYHDKEEKKIA